MKVLCTKKGNKVLPGTLSKKYLPSPNWLGQQQGQVVSYLHQ